MSDEIPLPPTTDEAFGRDLAAWGPDARYSAPSLAEAERYCQTLAHRHYENFSIFSWLLPRELRQHFCNVYAYCRWSDDIGDEFANSSDAERHLHWWHGELENCFNDQATHPVFVALRNTIHQHPLTIEPFKDLLSAFCQDQVVTRYRDDLQLLDYCRRSANPVGRIVLALAGSLTPTTLTLSDLICTGLQIANFCQDMGVDAGKDRIYLPRSRWEKHGVDESMILKRTVTPQLRHALENWVSDTQPYFSEGRTLVHHVPRWLSLDIELFIRGGEGILNAIRANRFDVWTERVRLTKFQKAKLIVGATVQHWFARRPIVRNRPGSSEQ